MNIDKNNTRTNKYIRETHAKTNNFIFLYFWIACDMHRKRFGNAKAERATL